MNADLARAIRRIMFAVSRGKLTGVFDDTGPIQKVQVDFGPQGSAGSLSIRDGTFVVFQFGFGSVAPKGTDAVVLQVGGDRNMALVIGSNHQTYRKKNAVAGESWQANQWGDTVYLTANGPVIEDRWGNTVTMAQGQMTIQHSTKIIVKAPDVELGDTGGPAVARVGDNVNLTTGKITSGSSKVNAA